jgi:hypothetical protein
MRRRAGVARDGSVGASELAQMGRCERLVVLESLHGASKHFPGRGAPRGIAAHVRFEQQGRRACSARWRVDPTTGRAVLHRDDGLRGRMADRCPARLQGCGPAAAALGATPGGGLLCEPAPAFARSSALPAVAVDDEVHPGFRGAWLAAMVGQASTMRFERCGRGCCSGCRLGSHVAPLAASPRTRRGVAGPTGRLRDAELICVESQFRSKSRWPIVARVDRAYRLPSGWSCWSN